MENEPTVEANFDGIVGPTHNYAGLSLGNVASTNSDGSASNPREAALEGVRKMRALHDLGVPQGVLPPHPRPQLSTLRSLGFNGSDEQVLAGAHRAMPGFLRLVSSASAMWAANAATHAPAPDTLDHRLHLVPANLSTMFHRSIEAPTTFTVLDSIFRDRARFAVHQPLPAGSHFSDEGAANHTRLEVPGKAAVHLLAWGRREWGGGEKPKKFPARQTLEASAALARLLELSPENVVFPQQHPDGIDGGAFHTDVVAVGHRSVLILHELAFLDHRALLEDLRRRLGDGLEVVVATSAELPIADAVSAYPFNSQIVTTADGTMAIIAPKESEENPRARAFLERVQAEVKSIDRIVYLDVRQSMRNGGGPACLRLRVTLSPADLQAIGARVLFGSDLEADLVKWIERHYRDRLLPEDLHDPSLHRENMAALDELSSLLKLGRVYDFQ